MIRNPGAYRKRLVTMISLWTKASSPKPNPNPSCSFHAAGNLHPGDRGRPTLVTCRDHPTPEEVTWVMPGAWLHVGYCSRASSVALQESRFYTGAKPETYCPKAERSSRCYFYAVLISRKVVLKCSADFKSLSSLTGPSQKRKA